MRNAGYRLVGVMEILNEGNDLIRIQRSWLHPNSASN